VKKFVLKILMILVVSLPVEMDNETLGKLAITVLKMLDLVSLLVVMELSIPERLVRTVLRM
jgi:hypothetical protein